MTCNNNRCPTNIYPAFVPPSPMCSWHMCWLARNWLDPSQQRNRSLFASIANHILAKTYAICKHLTYFTLEQTAKCKEFLQFPCFKSSVSVIFSPIDDDDQGKIGLEPEKHIFLMYVMASMCVIVSSNPAGNAESLQEWGHYRTRSEDKICP